jgi:hypothetical protein
VGAFAPSTPQTLDESFKFRSEPAIGLARKEILSGNYDAARKSIATIQPKGTTEGEIASLSLLNRRYAAEIRLRHSQTFRGSEETS